MPTMKETTWSILRELWAIRQHCRQIEREQRQQRWEPQRTGGTFGSTLPAFFTKVRFKNV